MGTQTCIFILFGWLATDGGWLGTGWLGLGAADWLIVFFGGASFGRAEGGMGILFVIFFTMVWYRIPNKIKRLARSFGRGGGPPPNDFFPLP